MPVHVNKKGIRALGVAESFRKKGKFSWLVGVVMRGDMLIDGFGVERTTVGGMDATDKVISLVKRMEREDINVIFLSGCVISWFNVVVLPRVYEELGIPLICLTYEESEGLEKYFKEYFPGDYEKRIRAYRLNGEREELTLKTGLKVFVRYFGLTREETETLLNRWVLTGRYPEPVRVARLLARALLRYYGE